jgi:hypothetical protein
VEWDATRTCELLVGLATVNVLGVDDEFDAPLVVHVESRWPRARCSQCGAIGWVTDRPAVDLVDSPCFGRPAPLAP